MAAMTTVLTEFSDNGNSRTYSTAGTLVSMPKLVIQKRRVPSGNETVQENSVEVVHGTKDSDGSILPSKVSFKVVCRYPKDSTNTEIDAAFAIIKDILNGDEYASTIYTQNWLS